MKNNNKKITALFSVLLVSSCATGPTQYTPVPFHDNLAFYSPYEMERRPANFADDCFGPIREFFNPKKPLPATEDIVGNPVTSKKITEALAKNPIRYPKGFEGQQGAHIQYGFETEYLHEEVEQLLKNYMPDDPFYKGTKEDWLALTPAERLKIYDDLIAKDQYAAEDQKFFRYRAKGKLVKVTTDPELNEVLPESFVYDAGHFEIVLDPTDSAEEVARKIKIINKHIGIGSMQLTTSNPINKELLKHDKEARTAMKAELTGYYNFMNDFDTLSKLDAGYERFLQDPKIQAAKSFNHPWLGPMTKLKHDKLQDLIEGIVDGKQYSEEQLKQMSYLVVSHKFIGGLSFRPDVAYKHNRLASEVRDCHRNVKCIEDRLIRETYLLMKGKEGFKKFDDFEQFDSVKNFKNLQPNEAIYMLRDIFPQYGHFTQTELELYRNFAYPFRDWSKHVQALGAPGLGPKIASAQNAYSQALKSITADYNARTITKEEAQTKVMGALTEFVRKSGLADAMKAKYNQLIDPEEIKYFDGLKFTFLIRTYNFYGESNIALAA